MLDFFSMLLARAGISGGGGGGFTPTTEQLAAMNSGITAEKLQTDENDISTIYNGNITWTDGYFINAYGTTTAATGRSYSNYVGCIGGSQISYIAETNHSNVCGISFYDKNKEFISGEKNVCPLDEIRTTIIPSDAVYFRLSKKNTQNARYQYSKTITEQIGTALNSINSSVCYVQTTGSDNNDGLTRNTPLASIQKAIDLGFKTINVKEGVYTTALSLVNKNGITITRDVYYDTFNAGTDEDIPKIIIDGTSNNLVNGIVVQNSFNCKFNSIEIRNTSSMGFNIFKCTDITLTDCVVHDCAVGAESGGGFVLNKTDADFYNCEAYNIGTTTTGSAQYTIDGFNMHGTGETNFYNCKAWNCEDDGISHHDACIGFVTGGEFYNCGKGGVSTPTHGAKVNVSNIYSHNNVYGLYIVDTTTTANRGNIIISNCVCKNNTGKDIAIVKYDVIGINCIYDTKEVNENASFTEFSVTG